jgi:hypothetical protein
VASQKSSAFSGCSGLDNILKGLEARDAPTVKPMAVKRRKLSAKAKLKPKPKSAAKAAAKAEAVPVAPVPAAPVAVGAAPVAKPVGVAHLTDTRKCVHSRASKKAMRIAKAAGLSPIECTKAASKAAKIAVDLWASEH